MLLLVLCAQLLNTTHLSRGTAPAAARGRRPAPAPQPAPLSPPRSPRQRPAKLGGWEWMGSPATKMECGECLLARQALCGQLKAAARNGLHGGLLAASRQPTCCTTSACCCCSAGGRRRQASVGGPAGESVGAATNVRSFSSTVHAASREGLAQVALAVRHCT